MKKTISLLALAFVACISISAQTQQQKVVTSEVKAEATTKAENYAEIKFDTLRHDFGKFSKEDPVRSNSPTLAQPLWSSIRHLPAADARFPPTPRLPSSQARVEWSMSPTTAVVNFQDISRKPLPCEPIL